MIKSSRRKHLENTSRVIHLQCLSEQESDSLNIYNIKNDKWDGIKLKAFYTTKERISKVQFQFTDCGGMLP